MVGDGVAILVYQPARTSRGSASRCETRWRGRDLDLRWAAEEGRNRATHQ